ncbi:hypothetical protein D3C83_219750 [compost metagenome]
MILALLLIAGGVVGAQFGARAGLKMKGEHLRLMLAAVVVAVCLGLAWGLMSTPREMYFVSTLADGE